MVYFLILLIISFGIVGLYPVSAKIRAKKKRIEEHRESISPSGVMIFWEKVEDDI
jgi:hypothetical protein